MCLFKGSPSANFKKFTGDEKKQLLAELLDPQVLEWMEQGNVQKCEAWLQQRIGEEL